MQTAVQTLTSEQLTVQAAGEAAEAYLRDDTNKRLFAVLVSIRQMYAVAYRSLQESLGAESERRVQKEEPPLPAALEDFLVQYAAYAASKPFSEHTLMQSIVDATLPWLADTIDSHSAADASQEKQDRQEAELLRRSRGISIGVNYTPMQEQSDVSRTRSLVLVGWRNAVEWLLDRILAHVGNTQREGYEPVMTIRLKAGNALPDEQHAAVDHPEQAAVGGLRRQ